jgi:hypothetical protein
MTNDRPWRLADLKFVPSGNGREKATINGIRIVREDDLFGKRKQEQSSQ